MLKRWIIAAIVVASLQPLAASADTAFTIFAFPATGPSAPNIANRTMPDRIADVRNVKDFGAVGDNSHDDTNNIQAAITAACNSGAVANGSSAGSVVYLPAGVYKTTASLTMCAGNASIGIVGAGRFNTQINGNYAGYVLDKPDNGLQNIELISDLYIINSRQNADAGAIRFDAAQGGIIRNCYIQGFVGVDMASNSYGAAIYNSAITNVAAAGTPGSVGVYMGQAGVYQTRITGYDIGIQAHNLGVVITGSSFEVSNTAILLGKDRSGANDAATGFMVTGNTTEQVNTALLLYIGLDGIVAGNAFTGIIGVPISATASWAGGTATLTTSYAHGLSGSHTCTVAGMTPSGYNVSNASCTYSSTNTVTYTVANPGGTGTGGTVAPLPQYGIQVKGSTSVTFTGNGVTGSAEKAGIDLLGDSDTSGSRTSFISNTGSSWLMPASNQKAGFYFANNDNPAFTLAFADLPGQAGVSVGTPITGMEYTITDALAGNCSDSACAWGANVTGGGGALQRLIRYNGTNWTVAGK
jgi:hypothetical protein